MTEATQTPAASDTAPAATQTTAASVATTPAATETPAQTTAGDAAAPATDKNSGEDAPAQGADQPDTDKAEQPNQSPDDQKPEDTDKKDSDGEGKEDGNQEAQPPQYEPFKMPEGIQIDQGALDEATPVLQELNANQEQAQKLVDIGSSLISNVVKNMTDQHNARLEGWKKQTQEMFGKDGDAKFQERVGRAEEMIKKFFPSEDDKTFLTHYGAGNHPGVFAMALALAEGTGEDRAISSINGNGTNGQKTLAQVWYPDT